MLGEFRDEGITFKLGKVPGEMYVQQDTKWSERRARGPEVGERVPARFYPPICAVPLCFLPTAQLDCRWGLSSINPIPLKERKKENQWL